MSNRVGISCVNLVENPLFSPGRLLCTPGAQNQIAIEDILTALARHLTGDWGNLCQEDIEENNLSLQHGYRLLSRYESAGGKRFWIITEADRSATTVLLPDEY